MDSQSLRPTSYVRPHSAHLLSPTSDIVGPSPVTSNGTETTEIDDEAQSETSEQPSVPEVESPPQVWDLTSLSCSSFANSRAAQDVEDEPARCHADEFE